MAVTYVANIDSINVASGNWTASGLPAGTVAGDLIVATICCRNAATMAANTENGWVTVHSQFASANANTIANSSHAAMLVGYYPYEGTTPDLVFYRTAGNTGIGVLYSIRGVSFTDPIGNSSLRDNTNTASPYTTTITAGPSGFLVGVLCGGSELAVGGAANCATQPTAGSWTEQHDANTTTGCDAAVAVTTATKNNAGGATGQFNYPAGYAGYHIVSLTELNPAINPSAPTSPTASTTNSSSIALSWTAAANGGQAVTGYRIERESPVGGGWSDLVANTTTATTSYENSGLDPGTQYNYRISAINRVPLLGTASTAIANTTNLVAGTIPALMMGPPFF